jgi:uncharacterized delta-60 repeat protein
MKLILKILLATSLIIQTLSAQQVGHLDESFGVGGKVLSTLSLSSMGTSACLQVDGKLIVAGGSFFGDFNQGLQVFLTRYLTTGEIDKGFGTDGVVFCAGHAGLPEVRVTLDSKILVGDLRLGRYMAQGKIDKDFDCKALPLLTKNWICDMYLQADEKILICFGTSDNVLMMRFEKNGKLDLTFGKKGKLEWALRGNIGAITTQPDGKIIVGGGTSNYDFIARLLVNGRLDSTFGKEGILKLEANKKLGLINDIKMLANGKILAAGIARVIDEKDDFGMVQCDANGTLDETFGTGGIVKTDLEGGADQLNAIVIQPNGQIIALGEDWNIPKNTSVFALIRYHPNGTIDKTFGKEGILRTDFAQNELQGIKQGILQPDGKIIAIGYSAKIGVIGRIALARYIVQ